jgi:hypothetical protein
MIHQRTTIPPDVWYESDTVGTFLANRVALPIPDMVWTVYDRRSIRETRRLTTPSCSQGGVANSATGGLGIGNRRDTPNPSRHDEGSCV